MSGAEADEHTVLDYLNEDCWRAVLDYLPLKDILRTESASQRWQEMVLTYLRGVRIDIKTPPRYWKKFKFLTKPKWRSFHKDVKKIKNCQLRLTGNLRSSFERWTNKLGPSVVNAYCDSADSLKMYENCPNLETLTIVDLPEETILSTKNENYRWLKRLAFEDCRLISDSCVSNFMANNTIEELEIQSNSIVTGKFLITKNSMQLKCLSMKLCWMMNLSHLLEASNYLSELRKLELSGSVPIYKDIHLMLDKMPKLEHVKMRGAEWDGRKFFEAVCRLKYLKELSVDFYVRDGDLEAVTRCCPELEALKLWSCDAVSQRGLTAALKLAGSRLIALCVGCSTQYHRRLNDDDIVVCARACPNLKVLNVRENRGLTLKLFPRVVAARREAGALTPLRLYCGNLYHRGRTFLDDYEELVIRP